MNGSRPGIALLLVFGMLIVLDLLVFGLMTIVTRERTIADARARWAEAEFQAEARLRWAQRNWATVRRGDHDFLTIDTAADGLFLLRLTGQRGGEAGLMIRTLALRSLAAAFPAGITTDGPLLLAGGSVLDVSSLQSRACDSDSVPLRSGPGIVWPFGAPLLLSGSRVAAEPAVVSAWAAPLSAPLVDTLQALADHVAAGSVSFELMLAKQACDSTAARTWGGELQTVRLCSGDYPLVVVDELILSGELRGVLLVTGTLRLSRGAQFTGAILLLGGRLLAEPGARIVGAVRGSGAGPILLSAAHLRFDPCAVWTALVSSAALNQPLPTTRTWIPVF